jgi:DNA-binding transcriptional LysR family regulator
MADNLLDMVAFVRVVEAGSLSAAARDLNVSLAVTSRRLMRLEERLGVRLINRTTRTLALTDEGVAFHQRCVSILAEIDEAEAQVTRGRDSAVGLLRVTSTFAFGRRRLAPLIAGFQTRHAHLQVHLEASDSFVNLVDAGYDLAIRFGSLSDSGLVARRLAPNARVICAAPSYLNRRGRPKSIDDLTAHDSIVYGAPLLDHWRFVDGRSVQVKGRLTTNDGELAHVWALEGAGLILKSVWDIREDLESGRLEVVLPDHHLPGSSIHAVYPHSRLASAKVGLFVDFLRASFKGQWASSLSTVAGTPPDLGDDETE